MKTTELDGATVSETRGVSSVEYTIRGSLQPVLDAIRSLFTNYPANFYGTHVHCIALYEAEYSARISRLSSCE